MNHLQEQNTAMSNTTYQPAGFNSYFHWLLDVDHELIALAGLSYLLVTYASDYLGIADDLYDSNMSPENAAPIVLGRIVEFYNVNQ